MSEVKWIKLATDIFNNRKIRQIENMPDGDSIIVIWLKLLCLAGDINEDGYLYFTEEIPYTDQLLATEFNRPIMTVQLALDTFKRFGMVEIIDDVLHLSNWQKYQNTEGLEKIREQTRKRVAKHRQLKALAESQGNVTCNVTVTQSNAPDIDKEEEKEIELERRDNTPYQAVVSIFNQTCISFSQVRSLSEARKKAIRARLNNFSLDDIETVFKKAEASDFLKGRNNRNWQATFDWLLTDRNFSKVLDGNYDNKGKSSSVNSKSAQELDNWYDAVRNWADGE